jgi:dTDP-D-glucose 4,6-dehydratase
MRDEQIIDASNFNEYFFDVRKFGPKAGQIMAKFSAVAIFGDGPEKRDLIKVLRKDKAQAAAMVMRKIHCAKEPDCYRVCREMCDDLLSGMSDEDVSKKEYEYIFEMYYYTNRGCIPKNDPHWETIDIVKFDPETNSFKIEIEIPESVAENSIDHSK